MGDVSLEQVLARAEGGLPVPVGCWLIARVAEALASAPRAVTPAEVRIGERGEVHIAPPRPGRTPFGYIAPEVVRGGDPDERSAIFGLGALLIETLTGRSPFARGSDMETRLAVTEEAPEPLHGRVPEASHELDVVLLRALAKQPAARFGGMIELAARIDAFLADELHEASPERLAAVVRAAMGGADPSQARPRGFAPAEHAAPLGEPKLAVPAGPPRTRPTPGPGTIEPARRPTPPPGVIQPARRPTPPPGVIQPALERTPPPGVIELARRPTPPPGVIEAARRPTPPPGLIEAARRPPPGVIEPARKRTPPPGAIEAAAKPTPPPGVIEPARRPTPPPGVIEPARRPTPRPGSVEPARPKPPRAVEPTPAPSFEDAELDLGPPAPRASHPGKPKLDQDVVRLGDPLVTDAGAGITDAALTGVGAARRTPARSRPAPVLAVDEEALRKERARGATVAPGEDDAPEPPAPNWFLRVIVLLVALLAVALAYQFVVRPLLK